MGAISSLTKRLQPCSLMLCLLFLMACPWPVQAQSSAPDEWRQLELGRFVVLYPAAYDTQLQRFAIIQGQAVNDAYVQLVRLYGESLPLPLTLRVYSDRDQFIQLNALVPPLGAGTFHTHLGSREIALIAPFPEGLFTSDDIVIAIRYELNGLLVAALSENHLPPALELGLNQYVAGPGRPTADTRAKIEAALAGDALLPWSALFEGTQVYADQTVAYPESLSIAAFLVDSYGFGTLVDFVRALADGHGYRAALARIYERPMAQLELEWKAYLPAYVESRWQVNALFNYDLEPFQAALEAGAYTQVSRALDHILPFLALTGQDGAQAQAEAMQTVARQGMTAGALVKATRDAVQAGEYARALALAVQARAAYAALGNASRFDEITSYAARAQEILELQAQVRAAERLAASGQAAAAEAQLRAAVPRLKALGDASGARVAAERLALLQAARVENTRRAVYGAVAVALIVLGHRLFDAVQARRRREPALL